MTGLTRSRSITPRGDAPMGLLLRVLLLVAMALSGWQVLQRSQALDLALPRNGVPGLERAVERDPSYSRAHFLLGMVRRDLPGSEDLDSSLQHNCLSPDLDARCSRYASSCSRAASTCSYAASADARASSSSSRTRARCAFF